MTKEVAKEIEAKAKGPLTSTWSRLRRCPRSRRKPRWHSMPWCRLVRNQRGLKVRDGLRILTPVSSVSGSQSSRRITRNTSKGSVDMPVTSPARGAAKESGVRIAITRRSSMGTDVNWMGSPICLQTLLEAWNQTGQRLRQGLQRHLLHHQLMNGLLRLG